MKSLAESRGWFGEGTHPRSREPSNPILFAQPYSPADKAAVLTVDDSLPPQPSVSLQPDGLDLDLKEDTHWPLHSGWTLDLNLFRWIWRRKEKVTILDSLWEKWETALSGRKF